VKIFVISNLYPSNKQPHFGTFVKDSLDALQNDGKIQISHKALIKGQGKNSIQKFFKYTFLYIEILAKGIFGHYNAILLHYLGLHSYPTLMLKKINPSRKMIINLHGTDILAGGNKISINKYKLKALQLADLIICPSNYFASLIISEIPEFQDKLYVSPSGGIDKNIFFRKTQRLPKDQNLIKLIYVGRIIQKKGWMTLLEAMIILKNEGFSFSLKIVGDGEDKRRLEAYIKENDLINEVEYLGGLPHEELGDLFRESDLFIFPTLFWESLGLVALEAMSTGTPVIASKRGAIVDYLKEGVNGLLITPGSSMELKEKILLFKELDDRTRLEMIEKACKTASEYEKEHASMLLQNKIIGVLS
jgi:L-malate glycosyltransferase